MVKSSLIKIPIEFAARDHAKLLCAVLEIILYFLLWVKFFRSLLWMIRMQALQMTDLAGEIGALLAAIAAVLKSCDAR